MLILLILSLILLTAVLYAQYRRSRALRRAARDLKEARMVPGTRLRLYSPDGKLEELLSQINGLLEDKERETRVLRSREESLRRQIANVSHDLRTPLTSILGYLQLMGREDVSPEEYRHCLEIVEGRAKVLQDLITSFYDLSRIEGGRVPPGAPERGPAPPPGAPAGGLLRGLRTGGVPGDGGADGESAGRLRRPGGGDPDLDQPHRQRPEARLQNPGHPAVSGGADAGHLLLQRRARS